MEVKKFLKNVPLFEDFSDEELEKLLVISKEKTYPKDAVIFQKGDLGNFFFLICSGRVKVIIETEEGKEGILSILYPTEFFGEMSLLDGEPRSATVVALEETRVIIIERNDFLILLYKHPELALKILKTLSLRLRKANRQIETLMFLDAPGKVARLLIDIAQERGKKINNEILIDLEFTRQELGNLIGVSRETTTRILKSFEEDGILSIERNQVIIKDVWELKRRI
ncbi:MULTISPECIES: Crp/Fnr family transcriptional regulator [Dictyoglomus]|uniref:cAMP receptor protein n=1 Tax=Dictyoglomus turgidum (strain DSM 6724 / Z-1310) TaxID=515635 RepID=B8E0R5_DICTD|nr:MULTISPECIES: Crp/Fnr family transcriptional regulator [Dictyoglomus]ACK43085.1 transcriptional regulator, Crp/Fnr family [Dictyoglomus turgidum DSM 6724]PNV79268.1 MAG: Crp/Fnr family transcriptional regulator [Dictyoglomus turgidum]HBU31654.1 Crp/Fnr family transcriptional regulator [Dictyoglomus sp.]